MQKTSYKFFSCQQNAALDDNTANPSRPSRNGCSWGNSKQETGEDAEGRNLYTLLVECKRIQSLWKCSQSCLVQLKTKCRAVPLLGKEPTRSEWGHRRDTRTLSLSNSRPAESAYRSSNVYIWTVEYYPAIKKNKITSFQENGWSWRSYDRKIV